MFLHFVLLTCVVLYVWPPVRLQCFLLCVFYFMFLYLCLCFVSLCYAFAFVSFLRVFALCFCFVFQRCPWVPRCPKASETEMGDPSVAPVLFKRILIRKDSTVCQNPRPILRRSRPPTEERLYTSTNHAATYPVGI